MKKIDNSPLIDFDQNPILVDSIPLTPVDVALNLLKTYRCDASKAGPVFKLGVKLAGISQENPVEFELEDAEHEIVKESCKGNGAGYYALIIGQFTERLET